jgi:two-component system response regulator YcbB
MKRTLNSMQSLFMNQMQYNMPKTTAAAPKEAVHLQKTKDILQRLGIIGEIGSKDIINVVDYMITHRETAGEMTLIDLCAQFSENPKSVEQRIRRTANTAMVNLAHLGLEDYSNDTFIEYSNTLFNFEQIRREMDHIRGKSSKGGNVKIRNFLNALVSYCYK